MTALDVEQRPTLSREAPAAPVAGWAVLGGVFLVFMLTTWGRWLLSGNLTAAPTGPDDFSGGKLVLLRVLELTFFAIAPVILWFFVVRPWIRNRTISFDGMLIIAMWFMWFWDPAINYFSFSFTYNGHLTNLGSWGPYMPGWQAPNLGQYPEPLLFIGGAYVWWMFGGCVAGCWVLRKLRARFPDRSILVLLAGLFVILSALDTVSEVLFIRTEIWAYPGSAPRWLTIQAGTRYQFPVYCSFLMGLNWLGMVCLRYFRDDRGLTFVHSGLDRVRVPRSWRKWVSFLAIMGFVQLWTLTLYYGPWQWMALQGDVPAMPSYMRNGVCGPGTDYACPGPDVPIPKRGSLHITPDDPRLPVR